MYKKLESFQILITERNIYMANNLPVRKQLRMQNYDYSQNGHYFITICTQNREHLFGDIVNSKMQLNDAGKMIETVWNEMPHFYIGINIDAMCIMPNHFHGIIIIGPGNFVGMGLGCNVGVSTGCNVCTRMGIPAGTGTGTCPCGDTPTMSLPDAVQRFKSMTTKHYTDGVKHLNWTPFNKKIWQRSYWDHIIRNYADLQRIQNYIKNNPIKWEIDKLIKNK